MISDLADKLFSPFCPGTLFVGFSGGADSTAALLVSKTWAQVHPGCRVEAVHFDHHLRGDESAREAMEAEKFASSLNLPFRKFDLYVTDSGDGIEAAARAARLEKWRELCAGKVAAVVLGHHADDRAENLLIRLLRGSNSSALTALRERSEVCGVTFLRPLIRNSRVELEAFLRELGVTSWQSDSSNSCGDFVRNYWRNKLLPAMYERFPWGHEGLRKALEMLELDAKFIESEAARFYASGDLASGEFWRRADPALRHRLLRRYLHELTGCDIVPSAAVMERLERALDAPCTGEAVEIPVSGKVSLYLQDDRLELSEPPPPDAVWDWRDKVELEWGRWVLSRKFGEDRKLSGIDAVCFDASVLPERLYVGIVRPGEKMIPFGRSTPESLHKLRIDRRVRARRAFPVLRDGAGIVWWACGVRRCAGAEVSSGTTEAVCFFCRERKDG